MTYFDLSIAAGTLAAFVIGFLLGDRRGVRQANAILDENMKILLEAMRDDKVGFPSDSEGGDDRPTVH
ncbi:MAG: hypothetical protein J0I86_06190 [Mesorhizobium sp.]|nr:hypothetical protein [Mesorhizobium sp.]